MGASVPPPELRGLRARGARDAATRRKARGARWTDARREIAPRRMATTAAARPKGARQ